MNTQEKEQIAIEVTQLAKKTSQNKVASKAGVSSATISLMINHKWDQIADELWRRVRSNLQLQTEWKIAKTRGLLDVYELLKATQNASLSIAISDKEGVGKTASFKFYDSNNKNVIYIMAKNYWSKKSYVTNLLKAAGLKPEGTTEKMIESFLDYMKTLHKPILIIDQADKLKDSSLDLFMDFYNELEGQCAFVLSGVYALEARIKRGCQLNKVGYREIFSRLGRVFIAMEKVELDDVISICEENGLHDKAVIKEIFKDCEQDIRRVKREVQKYQLINA